MEDGAGRGTPGLRAPAWVVGKRGQRRHGLTDAEDVVREKLTLK